MESEFIKDHDRETILPRPKVPHIEPKFNDLNSIIKLLKCEMKKREMLDCHTHLYFRVVLAWLESETDYIDF